MRRTLRVLVVSVSAVLTLAACEPSGDIRCDKHAGILWEIDQRGWTVDCTPGFPNRGTRDGGETWFPIWGWADEGSKTVWLWPDAIPTAAALRKTLWHELAHVYGIADEIDADRYSWCREPIDGVGYRFPSFPTAADCERLGA